MFTKYRWNRWEILAFFLMPLFLFASLEILRCNHGSDFAKAFADGFWIYVAKMLISYFFLLAVQSVLSVVSTRPFLGSLLTTVLFLVMGTASHLIGQYTGNPLLPNHVLLFKNAAEITGFVRLMVTPQMVWAYVVSGLGLSGYFGVRVWTEKKKLGEKKRHIVLPILMIVCGLLFVYEVSYGKWFQSRVLPAVGVANEEFDPWNDYEKNGLILTFFPRLSRMKVTAPPEYSREKIQMVHDEYANYEIETVHAAVRPNVIVIQSEALWDPTLLPNAQFSEDPMPFLRSLSEEGKSGWFHCPTLGGGTCLAEFETLTAYSMDYLSASAYPYSQYVTKEIPSVVRTFRENGYHTVGIHTYERKFYSRSTAYPYIGFEEFVDISDMDHPRQEGTWVSDQEINRQIISAYENHGNDPLFAFAVTMQNHAAYYRDRYSEYDISVSCDGMSDEDLGGLLAYTQGVKRADTYFRELTEYFSQVDEPVILVIYGDHLPLLGVNNSTYRAGGMLGADQSPGDVPEMYQTPVVVWSNMENAEEIRLPEHVSGGNLGLHLMKWADLDMPWEYKVMDDFYAHYMVMRGGGKYPTERQDGAEEWYLFLKYQWIQYDMLFGKGYAREMQ